MSINEEVLKRTPRNTFIRTLLIQYLWEKKPSAELVALLLPFFHEVSVFTKEAVGQDWRDTLCAYHIAGGFKSTVATK